LKNQFRFSALIFIIVAFVFSLVTASMTQPIQAAGLGTSASPYSVAEAIANQNNEIKTVQGYVVGQPTSSTTVLTSGYPNDYALALADSPSETNTTKMVYVQISTNYRSTFGLKSNPSLKGTSIKVTGNLTAYFTHPGVKNTTSMEKVGSGGGGTESPYDSTYYSTAIGKTGSVLKSTLHNIIDDHTEISYDNAWDALRNTDEDPNNKNNVILIYTGRSQGKFTNGTGVNDWNREHVWAKSHGDFGTTLGAGTDLHHLRPEDVTVNSSRGNKDFDNGGTAHSECTGCKADSDSWEPRDAVKGDVARMLFYMAVRYEGDSGEVNLELNELVNNGIAPYHGKLSTLLQWHNQDPVDDFERRRNDVIYNNYQHNRNPFIDHPEWVSAIWGN
jgi:endonuclease I